LNQHLREVARALSGYRDHEVVLSLLENWAQEAGTGDLATACLGLHRAISKGQPEQSSIPATLKSDLDAVLAVADKQFRTSGLSGSSHRILQKGLRRGRDRMDRAYRNYQAFPKSSNLHELRKRLKDHKYQLQLLAEVHPASAGELPAVSLLESILGNMRDGDLVLSRIMEYANANLSTGDLSQLVLFLESRSSRLAGEFEAEAKGYFRGE
jgi:CHAD domain-containing protein